jgi:N-acetylglucosamine-6-sulfatase
MKTAIALQPVRPTARRTRGGVLCLAAVCSAALVQAASAGATVAPSIVLIVTDDQRADTLDVMPTVQSELADNGVTFTEAFVTNPLCCPSRASILTGQYSHSNGVFGNDPPNGGFAGFDDSATLATWLQAAGYRTALVGKYLNGYEGTYVPPGWGEWHALSGGQSYYDYELNENGVLGEYGSEPADYSTDVLSAKAAAFVRETSGPLFLFFAPLAPHFDANRFAAEPAPRHADLFTSRGGLPPTTKRT